MPAQAWFLHFPDEETTALEASGDLPQAGDEVVAGWVVSDCKVSERKASRGRVDVWVRAKPRRTTIRQRTDRP
jgi:hypothetical protein